MTEGDPESEPSAGRVFRWDLDKTYLRTEFDTVRDLLKLAFESAKEKRTVPGAASLLREIRRTDPLGIYIVSGSPEQLRKVLEAKLRLDGIRWDSFTLKPQLSNIVRGKFRFVKDQVAYKLGALLETRIEMPAAVDEYLFGDDAEADAFIYSIYSDMCAGRVDNEVLMGVLREAGVYEDDLPRLVRLASRLPRHDGGRRIFIHLDRISSPDGFEEFGRRVCPFYNYLQPALVLLDDGALTPLAVIRVAAELVIHHAFTADALVASFVDLVNRGQLRAAVAQDLVHAVDTLQENHFATTYPVIRAFGDQLHEAAEGLVDAESEPEREIDYVALFARDKARAHSAKQRLRKR
ncbi:MAG: phosphatase domain-containing protein [Sandaracinaceae bacterium]